MSAEAGCTQPRNPSSDCYLAVLLLKMAAIGLVQMLIEAAEYLDRRERGKVPITLLFLRSCVYAELLSHPIPHHSFEFMRLPCSKAVHNPVDTFLYLHYILSLASTPFKI